MENETEQKINAVKKAIHNEQMRINDVSKELKLLRLKYNLYSEHSQNVLSKLQKNIDSLEQSIKSGCKYITMQEYKLKNVNINEN